MHPQPKLSLNHSMGSESCLHVVIHTFRTAAGRQGDLAGTGEVGDTIVKRLSVGATHVERLLEMTELENHESYSTGYATVTVKMLLLLLCWEFR